MGTSRRERMRSLASLEASRSGFTAFRDLLSRWAPEGSVQEPDWARLRNDGGQRWRAVVRDESQGLNSDAWLLRLEELARGVDRWHLSWFQAPSAAIVDWVVAAAAIKELRAERLDDLSLQPVGGVWRVILEVDDDEDGDPMWWAEYWVDASLPPDVLPKSLF